jgi:hypothetical protein
MGAHPKAPATANVAGVAMPLDRLIAEAPTESLVRRPVPVSAGVCLICLRGTVTLRRSGCDAE